MCKQEMTVDETTSEISPDTVVESQQEKDKDCVDNSSSVETEETNSQLPLFSTSTNNDADETESEIDSPHESNLPEEKDLIVSEDELVEPEQNALARINETLSDVQKLLEDTIAKNKDQTKTCEITQTLSELKELFEKQIVRNQNHIKVFDKMYDEMQPFKENSLVEAYQKPIIRNLIQLYDVFTSLESRFEIILKKDDAVGSEELSQELQQFKSELGDFRFELEEALYRVDVIPYEEQLETLNKKLHRTLDVKSTDDPEQDRKVAEVHKIGFYWRDKVLRHEEVTIYRYNSSKVKSADTTNEHTLNEEGGKTDE